MKKLEDTSRPMQDVLPIMSEWMKDKAVKFDPKANKVTTDKGDIIEYEYLVVATGLQLNYDQVCKLYNYFKYWFMKLKL